MLSIVMRLNLSMNFKNNRRMKENDRDKTIKGLIFYCSQAVEMTAPLSKKTKPASFQPQWRFSHARFDMRGGSQPIAVDAKRKVLNMNFNPIMDKENHDQPQKKDFNRNPNAPSFSIQYRPQTE